MAEERTRRRLTVEFETEAVRRLLEGGEGLGEVATGLGPSPGRPSGWRDEHPAAGAAEALVRREAEAAEVARLRREDERLEGEVESLEKAAAPFARGVARAGSRSWPPSGRATPSPRRAGPSARAYPAPTPGRAPPPPARPGSRPRPG